MGAQSTIWDGDSINWKVKRKLEAPINILEVSKLDSEEFEVSENTEAMIDIN